MTNKPHDPRQPNDEPERMRREWARNTIEGVPFAQPTDATEEAPWKRLDLFTREEAYALVRRRLHKLARAHGDLVRLHGWCLDKYGDAPPIPDFPTGGSR